MRAEKEQDQIWEGQGAWGLGAALTGLRPERHRRQGWVQAEA